MPFGKYDIFPIYECCADVKNDKRKRFYRGGGGVESKDAPGPPSRIFRQYESAKLLKYEEITSNAIYLIDKIIHFFCFFPLSNNRTRSYYIYFFTLLVSCVVRVTKLVDNKDNIPLTATRPSGEYAYVTGLVKYGNGSYFPVLFLYHTHR